jgi:hypothetical protein
MKELYKEYERRTSLAMIPFYMSRIDYIKQEMSNKHSQDNVTEEEKLFLQQNFDETERLLLKEIREV